jgi:phage tail sheath gpL-like
MTISFNQIPTTQRVPFVYVEFDNTRAVSGPSIMPYKQLVVGQRLSTGTVDELTPVRVTNAAQAKTYFGAGSMLANMLEKTFANNTSSETWAVAMDDLVAGTAATGSITVGGTISAGTFYLYIAGRRISVGVATGDDAGDVATAIVAAITADTDLPVTAEVNGSTAEQVDLTARHKGLNGNYIDLRHSYYDDEALPTGMTLTISAMASGAGNPDADDLWAALGDEHYNVIAWPWTDTASLVSLETELADRNSPLRMIEAAAVTAYSGTHSAIGTFGDSRNSQFLTVMNASGIPQQPCEMAAALSAVVTYYGQIDPARPFQTLKLTGILPPLVTDRFTMQENNLLLFDGISTFMIDAGGNVLIQRLITTYKTNGFGAEDISYLDLNTMLTLAYLRYDFRNYILRKYPRHKLASDGTRYGAGQAIITPKIGKAEAIARFRVWEDQGLVENIDQFKNDLICERNEGDPNRLDWMLPPDLVNQFRVGGVQIGFLL